MVVESRSVIRNAKNARGLGRDRAIFPVATAPLPESCASYFRFTRFNTFPLYYLRAWHSLIIVNQKFQTIFWCRGHQKSLVALWRPDRTLLCHWILLNHWAFSLDVTAAMLVSQTSPVGVELFPYANYFFCFNKFAIDTGHLSENFVDFSIDLHLLAILP